MVNINLSVVTVTLNNSINLKKTLSSLVQCNTKPLIVIVVDGGSSDDTELVVNSFRESLPIDFVSEPDRGIYDAMNKGKYRVKTNLIHYLNAGDTILGDPYADVTAPCLIPVCVTDEASRTNWYDYVKNGGYGYCHQGVIFPATHEDYDIRYDLGADFKLICRTFPRGLRALRWVHSGQVFYLLGGLSSVRSFEGKLQAIKIARKVFSSFDFLKFFSVLCMQSLLPRFFRRLLLRLTRSRKILIKSAHDATIRK